MAVVPMHKVQLLVHQSDADAALGVVQRFGAMEFRESDISANEAPHTHFLHAGLLPRTEHVVHFLSEYEQKPGLLKALREGTQTELSEADVAKVMVDTESIEAIVQDIEKLQVEHAEKTNAVRLLQERHEWLLKWKALPFKLSEFETKTTKTKLVERNPSANAEKSLVKQMEDALQEAGFSYILTEVTPSLATITVPKELSDHALQTALDQVDSELVEPVKGSETPEVELTATAEELAAAKGEVALALDQAEFFAKEHLSRLRIAAEILGWARDRYSVLGQAKTTTRTVLFTGWLNATCRKDIETAFAEKNIAATLIDIEPEEGEEPPVEIKNNAFIQPFEAVTRLYGMPGYKDLDPTLFLAGFFFLFFGLSLTDVGYGLSLVAVSLFILFACKVTKGMRSMAWLLLYIGGATVLIGALFGGYLGVDPSMLPAPLQAIQLFDPIGNPLPVFYLALSLGVFQVMVGMMLKIYSHARNGELLDGVLDQGPWLLMFGIGILYVLTSVGWTNIVPADAIGNLALVAVFLIVVTSGRHGEGVVGKIISAAAGLYAGVGYFSDILSYSRLLALGLATSALAYAVNLIAGMVIGVPYVGIILAAAILIVGHLFTLIINTLGAFVHSARLQFVEFFGKFIAGTGKDFAPLHRKNEYVTIRDD